MVIVFSQLYYVKFKRISKNLNVGIDFLTEYDYINIYD